MEMILLLLKQIMIMFVLTMIGVILYKSGKVSEKGSAEMGNVLLYLVIPALIINSFCIERTAENMQEFLESGIVSVIAMALCCAISWLIYNTKDGIACFSASFSNAGFIGIPLVRAVAGDHAVFYVSLMIVFVNLLQWTFGVFTITKDSSAMSPGAILKNPVAISLAIGLVIYILNIPVPAAATEVLKTVIGLNTPLAMIITGILLARTDMKKMFMNRKNYTVSLVRLVLIPLALVVVMRFLPFSNKLILIAVMIAAAAPVGSNVAVFAQKYHQDHLQAVEYVCVSTLLSVVTMPLMILLVQM